MESPPCGTARLPQHATACQSQPSAEGPLGRVRPAQGVGVRKATARSGRVRKRVESTRPRTLPPCCAGPASAFIPHHTATHQHPTTPPSAGQLGHGQSEDPGPGRPNMSDELRPRLVEAAAVDPARVAAAGPPRPASPSSLSLSLSFLRPCTRNGGTGQGLRAAATGCALGPRPAASVGPTRAAGRTRNGHVTDT